MMKFSKKTLTRLVTVICILSMLLFMLYRSGLSSNKSFPVYKYYNYSKAVPLQDSLHIILDTTTYKLYSITYNSVNDKKVTGLLSIPKNKLLPVPVIILMHGLGDHKTVDYIEYGHSVLLKNGYAVLRLDIYNHADRKESSLNFDLTGSQKYWSRTIMTQTVFDLRRAVDFIETRKELDSKKTGYFGISLGGIIGVIFCGVEHRIKVPVIGLAGGQMNLLFKEKALTKDAKDFVSIIEPLNFIKDISPRPLLMLNAKNDDIVPPMMSKLLYNDAKKTKNIIWYQAKHRNIPLKTFYQDGLNWFDTYLK
ncbi:alpha/beta hydrolase family protein [Confluentibacter sediminis]|uniref:alpha/beta hydrolase family protein n=1 Tax=Confluentibacter sediminis TaxID=2219045 RepID=UPI000DACF6DA|nr:acetylxylan esterase [Confluentibacter sediminis]